MGARPITDLGQAMLDSLPVVLRGSSGYQAVIHALARELELLEDSIEVVRSQLNPRTADVLLDAWEATVGLPVGGAGGTVAQRQASVVSRLLKLTGASEGREWEEQITEIIGQGWSYEEHVAGDSSSPAAYTLRITLPFAPSGGAYAQALREIREVTPAHLDIEFISAAGFVLDESELDLEGLHF